LILRHCHIADIFADATPISIFGYYSFIFDAGLLIFALRCAAMALCAFAPALRSADFRHRLSLLPYWLPPLSPLTFSPDSFSPLSPLMLIATDIIDYYCRHSF
jgi:hypothetical protein